MDEMIKREKHRAKEATTVGGLTVVELKNDKLCKQIGIDPTKKEQYLSDAEFENVMQLPRSDFNAMKGWKRAKLKKEAGL